MHKLRIVTLTAFLHKNLAHMVECAMNGDGQGHAGCLTDLAAQVAAVVYDSGMSFRRSVRTYYERNTRLFARFGSGTQAASVHRALWGPGVKTQDEALGYAHRLIFERLMHSEPAGLHALDLGCGVGGALRQMYSQGVRAAGVTLSPAQARLAARVAAPAPVLEADFHALPFGCCAANAFAIEAFAHSDVPAVFFAEVARVVRPGGRLIVIDDTLARQPADANERRLLRQFQQGWHTPSILPLHSVMMHAEQAGWRPLPELSSDLTPLLRLRLLGRRPGAMLADVLAALGTFSMVASASAGSVALQQLLAQGVVAYRLMAFQQAAPISRSA
jgi:cyclopropane fatty-acyl-phospholipid synthase-like methyltransferase